MTGKKGLSMAGLPWIAAMAFFMQALDATILNTALPAIAHSLGHSPLAMQSAIISYTLTVAMLIPVSGWLADRFGTRKVFILPLACLPWAPSPARFPLRFPNWLSSASSRGSAAQ